MRGDLAPLGPTLSWAEHDGEACLRATGLADEAVELSVFAGEAAAAHRLQPAAGRFVRTTGTADFIPRFPFVPGLAYRLVVGPCAAFPEGLVLVLRRPKAQEPATAEVEAVHPEVKTVPLNLLKVYVRFSEPMAEGGARRGVRVEDARSGEALPGVFLDMDPELWDPERRRLTLLLDPGRIKRGLAPHQEAGYPLRAGVSVRITIGTEFRSAAGAPLRSAFSRVYAVGPALRRPVDPAGWRWRLPEEGSADPLVVTFDRPLDRAMLDHALRVLDPAGRLLEGEGTPLRGEGAWRFRPSVGWRPGAHRLIVKARLEDLAGNSLRRVFDRDLTRKGDLVTEAETLALGFDIGRLARPTP